MRVKEVFEGAKSFAPLPAGDYLLRVDKAETKKTKGGDPMISLVFTINKRQNRKVWANLILTRKAAPFAAPFFRAVHKHPEGVTSMRDLMGEQVWAKLKVGEHEGTKRNEVVCWLDLPIPGQEENEDGNDLFSS
jgi:hypothetical protein